MKYVIRYTDGAYEYKQGSGFPSTLDEARRFDSRGEAEEHALILMDVDSIVEVGDD